MKYCSQCGEPVEHLIPEGDNRPRHVCAGCDTIYYQNPKIVTGTLPIWEDKVLLCKRAIEPRYGLWTVPAGFMEMDESMEQAALRESREEANANIEITSLYTVVSLPYLNQVYVLYLGRLLDLDFSAGSESLDVALFEEKEIPWTSLAFRTVDYTLKQYFQDRQTHHESFPTHHLTINKNNRELDSDRLK